MSSSRIPTETLRIQTRHISLLMLLASLIILLTNTVFYSDIIVMSSHSLVAFITSMMGLTATQKTISIIYRRRYLLAHSFGFLIFLAILWFNVSQALQVFALQAVFFCWVPCGVGCSFAFFPGFLYLRSIRKDEQEEDSENPAPIVIQPTDNGIIHPLTSNFVDIPTQVPQELDFSDFKTPPPSYSVSLHDHVFQTMEHDDQDPENPVVLESTADVAAAIPSTEPEPVITPEEVPTPDEVPQSTFTDDSEQHQEESIVSSSSTIDL